MYVPLCFPPSHRCSYVPTPTSTPYHPYPVSPYGYPISPHANGQFGYVRTYGTPRSGRMTDVDCNVGFPSYPSVSAGYIDIRFWASFSHIQSPLPPLPSYPHFDDVRPKRTTIQPKPTTQSNPIQQPNPTQAVVVVISPDPWRLRLREWRAGRVQPPHDGLWLVTSPKGPRGGCSSCTRWNQYHTGGST